MVCHSELWDTQAFWMLADEPIPVIIELELLGITSVHAWGNAQRWQISGVSPWIRIHVNTPVRVAADQAALGCHSTGDWQHAKLIITPVSTVVTGVTCRNGELSCSPEFRFDVHICDQCKLVPQQLQAHNTPCHKSISKSIAAAAEFHAGTKCVKQVSNVSHMMWCRDAILYLKLLPKKEHWAYDLNSKYIY